MTIRCMRVSYWVIKATHYTQNVLLIALPLQQLLNECVPLLRGKYIACPFEFSFTNHYDKIYIAFVMFYILMNFNFGVCTP